MKSTFDDPAPRPGQDGGAGPNSKNPLNGSREAGPASFLDRLSRTDDVTAHTLAALCWRQGRERFRQLGISPDAFDHLEAQTIAAVLLAERDFTPAETALLLDDDGRTQPWWLVLDYAGSPGWAAYMVETFARQFAARWLPEHLRWAADMLETGRWRFDDAAEELDRFLALARPSARKEVAA